jgi:hypothetical protein
MASAKWRHVAKKNLENGSDPDAAVKTVQYNTVVVAKSLSTLKRQYLDTGQVKYDQTRQSYVPVAPGGTEVSTSSLGNRLDLTKASMAKAGPSPEAIRAAATMNSLLSHLEQVDVGLLEVVPDDKLTSTDAEGSTTKMSVKDVFATDDGFLTSLSNFEQFNKESPEIAQRRDQFFAETQKFLATNVGGAAFDYSQISESPAYIQSRIDAAEIRAGGRSNIQLPVTDLKSYKTRLAGTEGGGLDGNAPHDLSRSSAAGTYGFTRGTWVEFVDKVMPSAAGLSDKEKWEMMKDPVIEDQIMEAFTKDNFVMLQNEMGKAPSWDELNVAHMLRYETPKFLKALSTTPMAPARSVLNAATIRANPELTSGTLLDFWNKRLKRSDPDWNSYMKQRQGVDSAPMPANNYIEDFSDEELENILGGQQ